MIYTGEPDNYKVPYLNKAFSAPKIWTVDAGYFAKLVRLPAWEIRRAPTYIWNNTVIGGANTWSYYVINIHMLMVSPFSTNNKKINSYMFSNQGGKIWSNLCHLWHKIFTQLCTILWQGYHTCSKLLYVNKINRRNVHPCSTKQITKIYFNLFTDPLTF